MHAMFWTLQLTGFIHPPKSAGRATPPVRRHRGPSSTPSLDHLTKQTRAKAAHKLSRCSSTSKQFRSLQVRLAHKYLASRAAPRCASSSWDVVFRRNARVGDEADARSDLDVVPGRRSVREIEVVEANVLDRGAKAISKHRHSIVRLNLVQVPNVDLCVRRKRRVRMQNLRVEMPDLQPVGRKSCRNLPPPGR